MVFRLQIRLNDAIKITESVQQKYSQSGEEKANPFTIQSNGINNNKYPIVALFPLRVGE